MRIQSSTSPFISCTSCPGDTFLYYKLINHLMIKEMNKKYFFLQTQTRNNFAKESHTSTKD